MANRFPVPPEFWSKERLDEHVRKIAQTVRGLLQGKSNNTATITLSAMSSTDYVDSRVTPDTLAILIPQTSTAASAQVWVVASAGKITIHHDVSTATDRNFGLVLVG